MEPLEPKIPVNNLRNRKIKCSKCNSEKISDGFYVLKKWPFGDYFPVCKSCVREHLQKEDYTWNAIEKMCQIMNIPFLPRMYEEMQETYGKTCFDQYVKTVSSGQFEAFDWSDYHNKFIELKRKDQLDRELPLLKEDYFADLALRWGHNYDHEQLVYLENLYNGMLSTQNVGGALQHDQAQKLCKLSLQIDERIRGDEDFDKLMSSYDKMVKVADFTPKNVKRDYDFSSFGEVAAWLEKRGWINKWYDDANRDIVDEVIHSNQAFVQRLYTNESGLGEEISERIEQLKIASQLENQAESLDYKGLDEDDFLFEADDIDLDARDNKAYEELFVDDVLDAETTKV